MKSYNEMANIVLRRIGEYEEKQKQKRKMIMRTGTIAACFCVAVIVGITAWGGNLLPTSPPQTTENTGNTDSVNNHTDNSNNVDKTNIGNWPIDYVPDGSEVQFIASYNDGINENDFFDTIPKDGEIVFSQRLKNAVKEYGNSVQYLVNVEVFSNGQLIETNTQQVKAVREKLAKSGYTVVYSTASDGTSDHYSFFLQATMSDLTEFEAYNNYGYRLTLY